MSMTNETNSCTRCGKILERNHKMVDGCTCEYPCHGPNAKNNGVNTMTVHQASRTNRKHLYYFICPFCEILMVGEQATCILPHLGNHSSRCLNCSQVHSDKQPYYFSSSLEEGILNLECSSKFSKPVSVRRIPIVPHEALLRTSEEIEYSHPDSTNVGQYPTMMNRLTPLKVVNAHLPRERASSSAAKADDMQLLHSRTIPKQSSVVFRDVITAAFFNIKDDSTPFQCYFCSYVTSSADSINEHTLVEHKNVQCYSCRLCQFKASRKAGWIAHMSYSHSVCTHVIDDLHKDKPTCYQMMALGTHFFDSCNRCMFKYMENEKKAKRKRTMEEKVKQRNSKQMKHDTENRAHLVIGDSKGDQVNASGSCIEDDPDYDPGLSDAYDEEPASSYRESLPSNANDENEQVFRSNSKPLAAPKSCAQSPQTNLSTSSTNQKKDTFQQSRKSGVPILVCKSDSIQSAALAVSNNQMPRERSPLCDVSPTFLFPQQIGFSQDHPIATSSADSATKDKISQTGESLTSSAGRPSSGDQERPVKITYLSSLQLKSIPVVIPVTSASSAVVKSQAISSGESDTPSGASQATQKETRMPSEMLTSDHLPKQDKNALIVAKKCSGTDTMYAMLCTNCRLLFRSKDINDAAVEHQRTCKVVDTSSTEVRVVVVPGNYSKFTGVKL